MKRCFIALAVSLLATTAWAGDTLRMVFTGDILLDRGVRERIGMVGVGGLFMPSVDSVLHSAHVVVGNLECPATRLKTPTYKRFVFRAEPEWLHTLRSHGFTHLNLANNHSVDQGRGGLVDTYLNVRKAGMVPVGAGHTMAEAAAPVLLAAAPRKVYLLCSLRLPLENFSYLPHRPSVSQESFDTLVARVRQLRGQEPRAYIVVSLHWGWEHHLQALPSQVRDAHRLVDAGANIIIGHHSHTLQTVESYHGRSIYYGIGNFIFDQRKPLNSRACMVAITLTAEAEHVETVPIYIERCAPRVVP